MRGLKYYFSLRLIMVGAVGNFIEYMTTLEGSLNVVLE